MNDAAKPSLASEITAALDWWREAGVDDDFTDQPTRWLAPAEAAANAPPPPRAGVGVGVSPPGDTLDGARNPRARGKATAAAIAAPIMDRRAWPPDLTTFSSWWLSEPALDEGRVTGRVAPRGPAGAEIMVIVPEPEREDGEHLLSGPQGQLLDAMLAGMGLAADQAYIASVLPRHTPMADWDAVAATGFGALLAHHIKLVGPRRLVALGSNILPLLGNDPAHNPAVLRSFNHEGLTIPLLAGKSLAALLERPRWKAGLWQGWLDWTGGRTSQG